MLTNIEKDKLIRFWSKECKKVDLKPRYCNMATINLFNKIFPDVKNKKILNMGCGQDILMDYFKKRKAKIIGIDICPEIIRRMRKKGFKVTEADCRNLPIKDNVFDITFSIGVVEHFKEIYSAIQEHIRVTKKGGKVVVIVPNKLSPFLFLASIYYLLTGDLFRYGKRIVEGKGYTKRKLREMMEGCKDIKIFSYSTSSLLRILTKKYNKKMANQIERSQLNKRFGFLLFAIGTKV